MMYSIVIPCYNEEQNIPNLISSFNDIYTSGYNIELVLVNNGSTDNSKEVFAKYEGKYRFLKIVDIVKNEGYGNGIYQGMLATDGQYIGMMHADMQSDPLEVTKAIKYIENNNYPKNIFIKGRRKNRPLLDTFFTCGMSIFETIYLKEYMYDITAQPTIFSRFFFETMHNPPKDFLYDLYLYYHAKKLKYNIYRFPIIQKPREFGKSSWNTGLISKLKLMKRVFEYSIRLKKTYK